MADFKIVGKSVMRNDAWAKVCGTAKFGADYQLPGMLYGVVLRSAYPHALIRRVDTEQAKKMPGVHVVATAQDVPGLNGFGRAVPDQPVICGDKVRFMGDAVALLAADTLEQARSALSAIKVEYQPLQVMTEPEEALAESADNIWDGGNVAANIKIEHGNVADGFAKSDIIIENIYTTPMVEHAFIEIECATAIVDALGNVTIWVTTQDPLPVVQNVARVLKIDSAKVRVIQSVTGGGFGGKLDAGIDVGTRAALLSMMSGRPVQMVYSREESIIGSTKRHPAKIRHKLGATKEGLIQAVEVEVLFNKGAYASMGGASGGVPTKGLVHAAGPYRVPNAYLTLKSLYTNLPSSGAMRGYGVPQMNFAYESQMDALALALNMDALEIRRKNMLHDSDITVTEQVLGINTGSSEVLEKFERVTEWHTPMVKPNTHMYRYGRGMSFSYFGVSTARFPDVGACNIYLTKEGALRVAGGIAEIGQGVNNLFSQLAAEGIGCPLKWVEAQEVDTAIDPDSQSTSATRGTTVVGNAVVLAAAQARETLLRLVASILECDPALVVLKPEGFAYWKALNKVVTLQEVAKFYAGKDRLIGSGIWSKPRSTFEKGKGDPFFLYVFAAHMAEVRVNLYTGKVDVQRFVAVHDVGKAINPEMVCGQISGGVSMGIGYALLEELGVKEGQIGNRSFDRYLLPTCMDMPEVEAHYVEVPNLIGPYGAKGIGEPPAIPSATAIANAVYDATGVRCYNLPLSLEEVQTALLARQEKN